MFLVLLLVIIGAAGVLKMTKAVPGLFRESGNVLLSDSSQKIEFSELNVSEEDVADGFYYQQLSEQEKQVYREILQGVRSMEETILLHAGENDEAGKIYEYLMYDRPELFWCDGSSKMTVYKDYTEFHPSYICTPDQRESRREQIENAAQEALAGAQGCETEYEKIKYIFKYLVDTVDYDQNALDNQNIYSSLVGKKSVCAGYSRAAQYLLKQMAEIQHIPELTALLSTVLPADLPALVEAMTVQLDRLSAASTDILEMMEAVPDLVNIVRYGNVRDLDFSKVGDMLEAMIARILAGGVLVCINIEEEAAGDLLNKLVATDYALSILNREELNQMWRNFIGQVRSSANVHPLLSGYATRLLNDKGEISAEEMETTLSFYSSVGNAPADMAYWFEGFLRSSGSILLLDDRLWNLVNNWVCAQDKETFMELLPVLRRTFSEFTSAERRKLGEKARRMDSAGTSPAVGTSVMENECLNREEAKKVIPVIRQLLGLETK